MRDLSFGNRPSRNDHFSIDGYIGNHLKINNIASLYVFGGNVVDGRKNNRSSAFQGNLLLSKRNRRKDARCKEGDGGYENLC